MSSAVISLLVAVLVSGAGFLLFDSLSRIGKTIPKDERQYMDPLPLSMRVAWPLISFFAFYIGERLSIEYLEKISNRLKRAGLGFADTPAVFWF